VRGWVGLTLVAIFWTLNWSLDGLRTHWGFFPLWVGYCLTIDALTWRRRGESLITRGPGQYVMLYVISAPAWWLFEALNCRSQNWLYQGAEHFSRSEYFVLCSVSFSTVMPAVFGTAEFVASWSWLERCCRGPRLLPSTRVLRGMFAAGALMLCLFLAWPRYFFPFLWASVFFLLEPVNVWLGHRSLLHETARGDWRLPVALSTGCLICGFFWEMWNFYSYPKWVYHVPFVDFWRVFEMPLLGYGGYVVFAWELFALHSLVTGGGRQLTRLQPDSTEDRPPLLALHPSSEVDAAKS
jgi:hypothetical protein